VDFEEWKKQLRTGGMSESSAGIVFSVLRGLYEAAVLNRMIHFSPFPPKKRGRRRTSSPLAAKREGIVVPLEQLERILLRLKSAEMLLALATAFTGMRWSEAAAMRRRFLTLEPGDPEQGIAPCGTYVLDPLEGAVHEDAHGHRFLGPPKSGPGRIFDLPAFLVLLLQASLATIPADQDILFPDRKVNYRRNADWNRTRWRPACDGKPAAVFPSGRARSGSPGVHRALVPRPEAHPQGDAQRRPHPPGDDRLPNGPRAAGRARRLLPSHAGNAARADPLPRPSLARVEPESAH
jgi:integrase